MTNKEFAEQLIAKARQQEDFTLDFAANIEGDLSCEWWWVKHITNHDGTDILLFDMYGGGSAFLINITRDYEVVDELTELLQDHAIFEIYEIEEHKTI